MSEHFNMLEKRRDYLQSMLAEKRAFVEAYPAGRLRTTTYKGNTSYYVVDDQGARQYLSRKDMKTIKGLAQKNYDIRVIKQAEKEIMLLDEMIGFRGQSVEDVYGGLPPVRRELVTPVRLPDDEYIRRWLESKKCEPMGFAENDPVILTTEGYRVRSKSEQLWADTMERLGVPHYFEPRLYLKGKGWVRPDFVGLNVRLRKEIWIEHLGMMDSLGYAEDNVLKVHIYERNGFILGDNLIITLETRRSPLDAKSIEALIKKHFL